MAHPDQSARSGLTVLCIDDYVDGLASRRLLLEALGYRVLTSSSGAEGLALLDRQRVDVVVLDYRMPEMDGEAVARRIRKSHPKLALVLLSGYPQEIPPRVRQLVDATVAKGSPAGELLRVLETLLGMRPEKKPPSGAELERGRRLLEDSQEIVRRVHQQRNRRPRE